MALLWFEVEHVGRFGFGVHGSFPCLLPSFAPEDLLWATHHTVSLHSLCLPVVHILFGRGQCSHSCSTSQLLFIPKGHSRCLSFRTDHRTSSPERFTQWDFNSYPQESGLVGFERFTIHLHQLPYAPANITTCLLINKVKGQPPNLNPEELFQEHHRPDWHSFFPSSKSQKMIIKAPRPVVPNPHQLIGV